MTIDAMGCQKEIAAQIVRQGGEYVLSLKGNHSTIHDDAQHFFDACLASGIDTNEWSIHETQEHGHGRDEVRRCYTTQHLQELRGAEAWKRFRTLGVIATERTISGETSVERRFFISSLKVKSKKFGEIVRAHWGIENSLHWVLDMAFREDESRVHMGHAAENLVVLRHLALNLLRRAKKYDAGIEIRRLAAGWDQEYLLEVLMGMN